MVEIQRFTAGSNGLLYVMRGHSKSKDARKRAGDPRIHLLRKTMDCGVKPGNDDRDKYVREPL
jgi:hypothetical protein